MGHPGDRLEGCNGFPVARDGGVVECVVGAVAGHEDDGRGAAEGLGHAAHLAGDDPLGAQAELPERFGVPPVVLASQALAAGVVDGPRTQDGLSVRGWVLGVG